MVESVVFQFFWKNKLIQVWKSMLKYRTHPKQCLPYHLKVDFFIQLLVKFQILINFLRQMLDFCLGCGNKKCWVWFLALIFLLLTFLFSWGNPYEAVQPVKTSIHDHRKIVFDAETGFLQDSFSPLELDFWLWYTNTNWFSWYLSWKLDAWCYFITSEPSLVDL